LEEISLLFLMLLTNIKNTREIFSNFSGLFRIYELFMLGKNNGEISYYGSIHISEQTSISKSILKMKIDIMTL
jgi:hypothetical protein